MQPKRAAAIRSFDAEWVKAIGATDAEKILSLYAENAVAIGQARSVWVCGTRRDRGLGGNAIQGAENFSDNCVD